MPSKNKNSFVNMSDKCLPKSNIKNVNFKPTYRCKVCKNSFKKFLIFEGHFAFNVMCRAKNGWIIQCYVCGQKFRYLSELKYHMGLHKIQKNKSVEQTDTRKNEGAVNGEHGNSRANDFRCTICQRKCRTKLCLNKHMLSHSKDVITKESSANGDLHAAIPLPSSTVTSEVPKTEQGNAVNHKSSLFSLMRNRIQQFRQRENCNRCWAQVRNLQPTLHDRNFTEAPSKVFPSTSYS